MGSVQMDEKYGIINTVNKDDQNYAMMNNGINPQAHLVCELLGVNMFDIQRFRDAGYDKHIETLWIMTRTGSEQHFKEFNNKKLTKNKYYQIHKNVEDDKTYEIYYFRIPDVSVDNKLNHVPTPDFKIIMKKVRERHERGELNNLEIEFMKKLQAFSPDANFDVISMNRLNNKQNK